MNNIEREFVSFSEDLQKNLNEKSVQIEESLIQLQGKCFSVAGDNSDKFVSCMQDSIKRLEREQQRLEFKTQFFQNKLAECLQNNSTNPDAVKKCKDTALGNIQKSLSEFVNNIKN